MQQCTSCWAKTTRTFDLRGCKHILPHTQFRQHFQQWPAWRIASFYKSVNLGETDTYNLSKSFKYVYGESRSWLSNSQAIWQLAFADYSIAEVHARQLRYATNYSALRFDFRFIYVLGFWKRDTLKSSTSPWYCLSQQRWLGHTEILQVPDWQTLF